MYCHLIKGDFDIIETWTQSRIYLPKKTYENFLKLNTVIHIETPLKNKVINLSNKQLNQQK